MYLINVIGLGLTSVNCKYSSELLNQLWNATSSDWQISC